MTEEHSYSGRKVFVTDVEILLPDGTGVNVGGQYGGYFRLDTPPAAITGEGARDEHGILRLFKEPKKARDAALEEAKKRLDS